ncbi:MAG TPA: nicotinate-nucleotide adenylyltransferase [Acidimicrobiales bacterium]|nr:nicotinate-nucleotide adenylyltransferase [Acidimicrobiales bacterium]
MRIGLFGGTFDPIHVGHIVVATTVHHALRLDEMHVIVAGDPWQKDPPPVAPAAERYAAVQAAIYDIEVPAITADAREVDRGGPTYTIDTVEELKALDPTGELFLVVGYDAAKHLDTWQRVDDLRALVTLVVVNRPRFDEVVDVPGWKVEVVDIPSIDVSSSLVRQRMAAGLPVDGLVPAAAMRVVRKHGRYAGAR